jgi:hypothetical protein
MTVRPRLAWATWLGNVLKVSRMSELERAQDSLEHATEAHAHGGVPHAKRAAIIIASLAAALALCETAAKDAQTSFLTHHIAASDTWSQYQGKSGRLATLTATADVLLSLPNAADAAVARRRLDTLATADRMRSEPGSDGMAQLAERAHTLEHVRDHDEHRHHSFEIASGGLQLAIVLVSVSIVTGLVLLMLGGGLLGLAASAYGILAYFSLL